MNADDSPRAQKVADMARILQVPAERDLPAGRRHLIKEHLMTELRTDQSAVHRAARGRRPRRAAWAAAGAGLLAAAAVTASVIGLTGHAGSTGGPVTAVQLLSKIADVGGQARGQDVTDNQFEYIETKVSSGSPDGKPAPDQTHLRRSGFRWPTCAGLAC